MAYYDAIIVKNGSLSDERSSRGVQSGVEKDNSDGLEL